MEIPHSGRHPHLYLMIERAVHVLDHDDKYERAIGRQRTARPAAIEIYIVACEEFSKSTIALGRTMS